MTTAIEPPPSATLRTEPAAIDRSEIRDPASKTAIPWHLLPLLTITILGGLLRFAYLDRPPIWGDEGMTFMRVSGTFQQLLDALHDWGFTPLHYELYWWIRQQTELTPFMLRLVPAIAGTLMIPAMYWLAIQLAGRRVAIVAALFTACSAYLLNYSRDAKMYMDLWLMCTVNFASLLWWLRARTRVAWWAWVASGCGMVGLHAPGAILLAIELLVVLIWQRGYWASFAKLLSLVVLLPIVVVAMLLHWTPWPRLGERGPVGRWVARRFDSFRWPPLALFVLGAAIMAIGPYCHYQHFSQFDERVERRGLAGGGVNWVETYNRGRDAMDLVLFTATAHLYSWEWPRRIDQDDIDPRALRALKLAGIVIFSLLAVGLLPWPWRGRRSAQDAHIGQEVTIRWPVALVVVSAWIVVPAYLFYCMSERDFLSPPEAISSLVLIDPGKRVDWPNLYEITDAAGFRQSLATGWNSFASRFSRENLRVPRTWWQWTLVVAGAAAAFASLYACGRSWRERLYKLSVLCVVIGVLFILCTLIYAFFVKKHAGSIWMPRYLGFVWPAVAIAAATLLMRLPTRPLRWAAVALLVGINLAVFSARVFAGTEPPTPIMAQDLLDSQPRDATTRMYYAVRVVPSGAPGTGYLRSVPGGYYLTILSGRATNPEALLQSFHWGRQWSRNWRMWTNVNSIPADLRRSPQITRIIVWDNAPRTAAAAAAARSDNDRAQSLLGDGWKRVDEQLYPVRDHWTWRQMIHVRRRVYERRPAGSTQPTTQASSRPTTIPS